MAGLHQAASQSLRAIFVYSLDTRKATQVTDGMSDALYPVFDKNGKYLYFTASTDVGPRRAGWTCRATSIRHAQRLRRRCCARTASPLRRRATRKRAKTRRKTNKKDDKAGSTRHQRRQ